MGLAAGGPSVLRAAIRPVRRGGNHRAKRRPREARDVLFVIFSTGAANIVLYLFPSVVAQMYSPASFGLFSSLFGIVVLFGLGATAMQTSVASRISNTPEALRPQVLEAVWRQALGAALVVAAALSAASPLIRSALHVETYSPVLTVIAVACTLAPWSSLLGAFQGLQRFRMLGCMTLLQACTRLLATGVVFWSTDLSTLFLAVAGSIVVSFFVGTLFLGELRPTWRTMWRVDRASREHGRGAASLGWSLLTVVAVTFPTVVDVIFVRHFYVPHEAGLYASAALAGRCVIFLPVGINAVIFPRYLASHASDRVRLRNCGLALACTLCGLAVIVLGARPSLTIDLLVGGKYDDAAGILRLYLIASFCFALASIFAFYELARANRRYSVAVLLPYLLLLCAMPALFSNLRVLVLAMAILALSLLICSAVTARISSAS